jgi:hypothetical protein
MIESRIGALVLIAAVLAFALPASAGPKGKAGHRGHGKGVISTPGAGQNSLGARTSRPHLSKSDEDGDVVVRIIDDAFGITHDGHGLPTGLAKRHTLPPGLARRSSLPPGLAKGHGTPPGLANQSQLPPGLRE